VLLGAYCGLRAGKFGALKLRHVDLLHHTTSVVEQVQYISGKYVVSPPKSAASRRSVSVPSIVVSEL
jgi:hypothetical protein